MKLFLFAASFVAYTNADATDCQSITEASRKAMCENSYLLAPNCKCTTGYAGAISDIADQSTWSSWTANECEVTGSNVHIAKTCLMGLTGADWDNCKPLVCAGVTDDSCTLQQNTFATAVGPMCDDEHPSYIGAQAAAGAFDANGGANANAATDTTTMPCCDAEFKLAQAAGCFPEKEGDLAPATCNCAVNRTLADCVDTNWEQCKVLDDKNKGQEKAVTDTLGGCSTCKGLTGKQLEGCNVVNINAPECPCNEHYDEFYAEVNNGKDGHDAEGCKTMQVMFDCAKKDENWPKCKTAEDPAKPLDKYADSSWKAQEDACAPLLVSGAASSSSGILLGLSALLALRLL